MSSFQIINRINTLVSSMNNLNNQVNDLTQQLRNIQNQQQNVSRGANAQNDTLEDTRKQLSKLQIDLVSKTNEIKKEIEMLRTEEVKKQLAKEVRLLEATIIHKVEQQVNKTIKDRLQVTFAEIDEKIEKKIAEHLGEKSAS